MNTFSIFLLKGIRIVHIRLSESCLYDDIRCGCKLQTPHKFPFPFSASIARDVNTRIQNLFRDRSDPHQRHEVEKWKKHWRKGLRVESANPDQKSWSCCLITAYVVVGWHSSPLRSFSPDWTFCTKFGLEEAKTLQMLELWAWMENESLIFGLLAADNPKSWGWRGSVLWQSQKVPKSHNYIACSGLSATTKRTTVLTCPT